MSNLTQMSILHGVVLLLLPIAISAVPSLHNFSTMFKTNLTLKSNNSSLLIPKPESLVDVAKIYNESLARIANYCLSDQDYEEAYGNKSRVGVVKLFFNLLAFEAYEQIAVNELRQLLRLKPQNINLSSKIAEDFVNSKNHSLSKDELQLFQQKVWQLTENYWAQQMFTSDDINAAEKFLDRKFPEIRQLFRLKLDEVVRNNSTEADKKEIISKLYRTLLRVRMDVGLALKKSDWNSANGDILEGGPKCKQNFQG